MLVVRLEIESIVGFVPGQRRYELPLVGPRLIVPVLKDEAQLRQRQHRPDPEQDSARPPCRKCGLAILLTHHEEPAT